ncbi:two-component system regulatory protein YycI [Cytobacillus sp. S13-E01]|uniref:two-component system regulatory protein YycI n=1 Tax=Cytobacillus sp. S13-E01 TaxID=3031326 RepID=UPI0023D85345|nr:two-component system regulatory protein YycI [Cytobacillus sp. S13-E01]MDF0728060.1 two-component system regulatory protein YycI [Cytobacillus sp. S13-E01]
MKVDWSKTKTIFIVTFLILDLVLIYQFIEKRSLSQLDLIREASIEEQLETEEITYVELPKQPVEGTYISGKSKIFLSEDINRLKNQEIILEDPTILRATFTEPIKFTDTNFSSKLNQFLKDQIISGESYVFWDYNEDTKTIILFQQYNNDVFYNNPRGLLAIYLNDNNEIVSYMQTLLMEIEEYDNEEILSAIQSLEYLYRTDYLKYGSKVTKIELGYYPLVNLSQSQFLTPTWHIVVDDKTDYYVNAIEGQIIEIQE